MLRAAEIAAVRANACASATIASFDADVMAHLSLYSFSTKQNTYRWRRERERGDAVLVSDGEERERERERAKVLLNGLLGL